MEKSTFMSAKEAAAELGISRATLYAYVSRGLIRSEGVNTHPRDRRYRAEDVQRLKERKEVRKNPAKSAEQALSWGMPVLESGLTLISNEQLFYRGQDALALAQEKSLEEVAAWLWAGEEIARLPAPTNLPSILRPGAFQTAGLTGIPAFQAVLLQAEAYDPTAFDLRPASVATKGLAILQLLARTAAPGQFAPDTSTAQILQTGWFPDRPEAARWIDAALVLCADHELNVSAFTARCVASAGASPYAAVVAALSALQGYKHGGATRRVEALFEEVEHPGRVQAVISGRLRRGEQIPGFGHPLYPGGDPRARLLLGLVDQSVEARSLDLARALIDTAQELIGERPTIDFALVCLARALQLPAEAALMLFAIGRSVGWVAHILEQYRLDQLIRPRARYNGPPPV